MQIKLNFSGSASKSVRKTLTVIKTLFFLYLIRKRIFVSLKNVCQKKSFTTPLILFYYLLNRNVSPGLFNRSRSETSTLKTCIE